MTNPSTRKSVPAGERVFISAEVGINHNGDMDIARKLIDVAAFAGCDAVKFQKRTIDLVYTKEFLDSPRESPWGTTQRAQKEALEFGEDEYDMIDDYCRSKGIEWYASAWDIESQSFLRKYDLRHNKVASPLLTHTKLLKVIAEEKKPTFISTGMSTIAEIEKAVALFRKYDCPFELQHCNSSYPMENEEANLRCIITLRDKFGCKVGYSGHERGLQISLAAVALGATSLERHITLDRAMYGSDQAASVEPHGLELLVRDVRIIEAALGDGVKTVHESEIPNLKKLRVIS
ncbi:MAG: N-acetylneuraminate synthase family protein [Chloroflexi bacterium]|nr:N-acetylneuraminate synthase family protein [Chloroflexota bacterium]